MHPKEIYIKSQLIDPKPTAIYPRRRTRQYLAIEESRAMRLLEVQIFCSFHGYTLYSTSVYFILKHADKVVFFTPIIF